MAAPAQMELHRHYHQLSEKDADAVRFESLTYFDVLQRGLKVMDSTAISLCMENRMPILVFNMMRAGNIVRAISGEQIGTIVGG